MGANIGNLQVWSKGKDIEETKKQVIESISEIMDKQGLVLCTEEGAEGEDIVLATTEGKPWVGVYMQEADFGQLERLEELGRLLTKKFQTLAYTAMVYDSDILILQLFENGECIDQYNNCPDYWGEPVTPEMKEALKGSPDKWVRLLKEEYGEEDIYKAFNEGKVKSEETYLLLASMLDEIHGADHEDKMAELPKMENILNREKYIFAEYRLEELAKLFDIGAEQSIMGYGDAMDAEECRVELLVYCER